MRLVDAEEGRALNRDFRQKDYATNVLTFDYTREPVVVADLILCAPVVEAEAAAQVGAHDQGARPAQDDHGDEDVQPPADLWIPGEGDGQRVRHRPRS